MLQRCIWVWSFLFLYVWRHSEFLIIHTRYLVHPSRFQYHIFHIRNPVLSSYLSIFQRILTPLCRWASSPIDVYVIANYLRLVNKKLLESSTYSYFKKIVYSALLLSSRWRGCASLERVKGLDNITCGVPLPT